MSVLERFAKIFRKEKVALVLGGGSARGIAHIGVLRVLQKEKIKFDLIVGTSIGAFIGAHYALSEDIGKAEKMALAFNSRENMDFAIPPTMGLIKGERIYAIIKDMFDNKTFADTKIPMAVVACDIEEGTEVVFTEGLLSEAVRASCSYPGIFEPQRINNRLLVDGGIISTVPTGAARRMGADIVIAVDVGFCIQAGKIKNIFGIILQAFQITGNELNRCHAMHADIVVRPELDGINQLDFDSSGIAIHKGEAAALRQLQKIRKKVKKG